MNQKNPFKLDWQNILSSVVIGLGTVGITSIPATAVPLETEIRLSQVGVHGGVTTPTPLNLRPRIHIPAPRSNYHRHRNRHYGRYRRDCSYYGNCRHTPHIRSHRKKRRNSTTIIIINSDNDLRYDNDHRSYDNHRHNRYIRIIKK